MYVSDVTMMMFVFNRLMKHHKHPFRLIFFSFLLVCLLTGLAGITRVPSEVHNVQAAPPMQAVVAPHVMISEFRSRGPASADDEFIEIFNATGNPVSINGWTINRSIDCGAPASPVLVTLPNISLAPGQYYLVGRAGGYTGSVDQTYSSSIADTGGIALLDASNNIVDQVGM